MPNYIVTVQIEIDDETPEGAANYAHFLVNEAEDFRATKFIVKDIDTNEERLVVVP
jgi:hypothetical protein